PDVLDCLRDRSAATYTLMFAGNEFSGPMQWFPVSDSVLRDKVPLEQIVANGGTVPLLIGTNREEDGNLILEDWLPTTWTAFVHETIELFGEYAGRARSVYPASDYESLPWTYIIMETDLDKTCQTRH